jgi:hypothetical protein
MVRIDGFASFTNRETLMTATATQAGHTLDSILDQLDQFHQRATYGAVAGIVDSSPRSLMSGREREPHSSWIVRHETGQPTGYSDEQKHPSLTERERIISMPDELRQWLSNPE